MMINKKIIKNISWVIFISLISINPVAYDYVPSKKQNHPILLKDGDLYTISNGVQKQTDLLFDNGRIIEIAKNIHPPADCEIIDITGKQVYPGIIAPNTQIGLIEIGAVKATNDISEIGKNNADVQSHIAYNPDSEIIPSVRSNGITTALIVPGGGLIKGRSSLINLDGWTKEDAMEKENVGLHISWPSVRIINAWWMEKSEEEQKKENAENILKIFEFFDKAKAYLLAKQQDPDIDIDSRWEAMLPIFSKELPVFIHANDFRQIDQAIIFSQKYGLKMILVGGNDSWKIADKLNNNNIPVILSRTQSLPPHEDDDYALNYKLPKMLSDKSVKFCLSFSSTTGTRNLPFQASQAVAFGFSREDALRAITLSTAEILGVEKDLGSLEIGKKATIIVSDGDIMNHLTHNIIYEFIEGKPVDLDNKHKELYRKYRQKTL